MIGIEIVNVRLAVRHDEYLCGFEMIAHHLLERLRRPILMEIDFQALLLFRFGQHLTHLRQDWLRGLRVIEKALTPDVADQDVGETSQLQPRDQHQQQRKQQQRDADEHQHEIAGGPLTSVDETHIVQQQHAVRDGLRVVKIEPRHLHRAGR